MRDNQKWHLEIQEELNQLREYGDYRYLKFSTKSRIFDFEIGDSSNNLKLYKTVIKGLGIKQELDEQFEDYQEIYDETLNPQGEEKCFNTLECWRIDKLENSTPEPKNVGAENEVDNLPF